MNAARSGSIADWPVRTGSIGGSEVVLATAGLGKLNAAALSALVWERHRPALLVFTGVAGDVFLQDGETRDRIFADLPAQAIEMEGAALGQTATRFGVDRLVVRSVSDLAADEAVEHLDGFVPEVSANSVRLALALVERIQEDHRDLPLRP